MHKLLSNETLKHIEGSAGSLELAISFPADKTAQHIAIICHPHPLYGGTMYNKVVTAMVKAYQALGFMTVRFNFRGVGASTGEYSHGSGELEDLFAVMAFANTQLANADIYLAGFSFGAYIATLAADAKQVAHLVTIAPPVRNFVMQDLHPSCPWVLIQGDEDEIVTASEVYAFAESRKHPPKIIRFAKATHFFHGHLKELQEAVQGII